MVFDVSTAMTWLLFLALFPVSYFWLRNAWRILVRHDYSEVALKRGNPPANPGKFAPWAAAANLVGAAILLGVIGGIAGGLLAYETWSAIAGSTIWMKLISDFILSRQAHLVLGRAPGRDT